MKTSEKSSVGNKKKLTICLLTFNRDNYLKRTLEFLKEEYDSLDKRDSVEIIISDNHSTDRTESIIKDFITRHKINDWIYNRNKKNIGLKGNLLKGESLANGEYLWWWGDDDHYKPGIVNVILNHIEERPDYIFINHSASKQDCIVMDSALSNVDVQNLKIETIIKCHPGYLMFMSASVYKKAMLEELHKYNYKINLAFPLLYSLYCASKGNYIIEKEVWIDDNCSATSWANESSRVFYIDVPYYISLMPKLGYNRKLCKEIYNYLYPSLWKIQLKIKTKLFLEKTNTLKFARKVKNLITLK